MRRFFKYVGIFVVVLVVLVVIVAIVAAIGMALPAGHEATRSARINAPITVVYRLLITERGAVPNPLIRAVARVMMSPTDGLEAYLRNLGRRFGQDVTIEP